ncbi:Hypothetical predicted protein [Mytilus galloprovincialis]|uniref:Uncharacterized protein n=1 Tax=Mytilus galloprovincialis TaxID=29158 RepID=A0A8B6BQS0_MYTGA|nr:Hypothetical predicted protein [Mytilus galloprovincialis]
MIFAFIGDVGNLINSVWTGQEILFENSALLPGAHAIWVHVAKAVIKGLLKRAKKRGGSVHRKGKRPSTKGKHEKGQSRKQKEQDRASGKKQKGGKDGSKTRG